MYICRMLTTVEKQNKYESLLVEVNALCNDESDKIANLSNIIAALHNKFNFWWTGFYEVKDNELVLSVFQGPVACTRIAKGKGVCGTAWAEAKTQLVPNVHEFPGHIACSAISESEIVVPVLNSNNEVAMVLDIDSEKLNNFDEIDQKYLEQLCDYISKEII